MCWVRHKQVMPCTTSVARGVKPVCYQALSVALEVDPSVALGPAYVTFGKLVVIIIAGTFNGFMIVRLPMQRREQKLLQFGWSAPEFSLKMSLAWAIPNQGDGFHSIVP